MKRLKKILIVLAVLILGGWLLSTVLMRAWTAKPPPLPADVSIMQAKVETRDGKTWLGQSWVAKREGLTVIRLKGSPFDMGYASGKLLQDQMKTLEDEFLVMIHSYVPQEWKLKILKGYVMFRNRRLSDYVSLEDRLQIYGTTLGCPDPHPELGAYYNRLLNYHAAQFQRTAVTVSEVATRVKVEVRIISRSPARTATGALKLCLAATMSTALTRRSPLRGLRPVSPRSSLRTTWAACGVSAGGRQAPSGPMDAQQVLAATRGSVAFIATPYGTGSAIVIGPGLLVTNAHVVEPFDEVTVTTDDAGQDDLEGEVVGLDLAADVAVVQVDDLDAPALDLADDTALPQGSDLYLVGFPGDQDDHPEATISRGVLSRRRTSSVDDLRFLQTDATIGHGQSGSLVSTPST